MKISLTGWRLFAGLSLGWIVVIAVLYGGMIHRLPPERLHQLAVAGKDFFFWQIGGFLALIVGATIWRPGSLGRLTVAWLAFSTLGLLTVARDPTFALKLVVFVGWCLATVRSLQWMIRWRLGEPSATWGLAAATLYSCGLLIAFFLGLLGLLNGKVVTLIALAAALPGVWKTLRQPPTGRASLRTLDALNPFGVAALEAIWVCLALAFVWACGPESFSDSVRSYLPDVQAMARHHSLAPQLVDLTRLMPRALQAFCAMGYVVGSTLVAKWLSWFALVPLAALISGEIRRRSGDLNLGLIGAAAVITCPLLLNLSTTLMYDHVMTMLCVAGFVSLFRALEDDSWSGVGFSALLMGAASAIKYNFLIFDLIWGLSVAIYAIRTHGWGRGLRRCLAPALILAAAACPWYLYNWAILGNPVFPFLNEVFQSPHWPGDLQGFKVDAFALGEGIWSPVLFPWTVTFHTHRVLQGDDGRLGFALLALLPWILARRQGRRRNGFDLGLAGMAIVICINVWMPYARYWLPGLPLLLIPFVLALGAGLERASWRLPRWATPIAGLSLLAVFYVQIPFWAASTWRIPWPVYTQKVTSHEWSEMLFSGLPGIDSLNRALRPGERVLVTAYPAVHTVDGDAYEFPSWHRKLRGIEDSASFDAYLERQNIRYWVVDFSFSDFIYFNRSLDAGSRYWTLDRLVAGSAEVGIFDVSQSPRPARFQRIEQRKIHPSLDPPQDPAEGPKIDVWQDRFAKQEQRASRNYRKGIEISPRGQVNYFFRLAPETSKVRLAIGLGSKKHLRQIRYHVQWLDENGQEIDDVVRGELDSGHPRVEALLFADVPKAVRYGKLKVFRRQPQIVRIRSLEIDFLLEEDPLGSGQVSQRP